MKLISEYKDAEQAFQGAKAEIMALVDRLQVYVEAQELSPLFPWAAVSRLTESGRRVELAISIMSGEADATWTGGKTVGQQIAGADINRK